MWRFVTVFLFLLLVACEPTETEEIIPVSDTPYIEYVYIGNSGDNSVLVPKGQAMAVNDVEEVTFEYQLRPYSEDITTGFIRIEAIDILIDGKEDYTNLVQITILDELNVKLLPIINDVMTVKLTVELLEPIDEQEAIDEGLDLSLVNVDDAELACEAICGKSIEFDVSFVLITTE
ncbi:hypothetical protein [Candidatus Xianfuyuplasma coldseepsis]|uniref:Lipoprotein n=1 Tax=Candidatus Xianfuyuplasma coldseepsis TaxID=2782163 RepID=A0A7L7KQ43_9MOLU|nr:hypothetical protein [Xianfuyuplasma coldseepsis]QMS84695.1 hypothetical protein G4Z02_02650 [Xianfuyuplasma coldseepsis]